MSREPQENQPPEHVPGFYLERFGFTERPFTLVPDPSFLYWSDQHKRAFSVLEFGILSRAPITLVTGAVGCGKTTLLRQLLKNIESDSVVGLISNAQGGRGELIQWVLHALGVKFDPDEGYVSQFQVLQDFLIKTYAEGRRVILIFDEAQNLSQDSLEELRMLTNINSNKDELIQLVLVGQNELREMIKRPELRQLAQRIAASFHLRPLTEEATSEFIVHRLRVAGAEGNEHQRGGVAPCDAANAGSGTHFGDDFVGRHFVHAFEGIHGAGDFQQVGAGHQLLLDDLQLFGGGDLDGGCKQLPGDLRRLDQQAGFRDIDRRQDARDSDRDRGQRCEDDQEDVNPPQKDFQVK